VCRLPFQLSNPRLTEAYKNMVKTSYDEAEEQFIKTDAINFHPLALKPYKDPDEAATM
jgi:hypothetical protein